MVRLGELLADVPHRLVAGEGSARVRDIVYDSRLAGPGSVFVAVPGLKEDGAAYAADAAARGAAAIVAERDGFALPDGVALAIVPDARRALADLSAARWGHPTRRIGLVGVTGTDGKTTTATLVEQVLAAAGEGVGLLTTVEERVCGRRLPSGTSMTTPAAPEVQRSLARMVRAGASWAVLEVSSHALALDRVAGCAFDVAVMTNVTPEHLDFHGGFAQYVAAKTRLFAMLGETPDKGHARFGVVNADDPSCEQFRDACPMEVVSYGIDAAADVRASRLRLRPDGSSFVVESDLGRRELDTRFVGRFNVSNWLAAISVGIGRGVPWGAIEQAARIAEPPAGRLEPVEMGQRFGVWIDFAHTPQALREVLRTARMVASGRVIVVFGAAGERYPENRPEMGAVAEELADEVIVTTDDAYSEEPAELAAAVVAGAPGARVILDRRAAMESAFRLAEPGDLVVVAGRGHERVQTVGAEKVAFEDVRVARELLRGLRPRHVRGATRAG